MKKIYLLLLSMTLLIGSLLVWPRLAQAQSCANVVPTNTGKLSYTATIPQAGTYHLLMRIQIPSTTNNSLWVQINQNCATSVFASTVNKWVWVKHTASFTAGSAAIDLTSKQDGIKVDRLIIVPSDSNGNPNCIPIGTGDNCATIITVTQTPGSCPKKSIGDADCKAENAVTIFDYAIWHSEFIAECSDVNLVACGTDADGDGSAMDANFNFPGANYSTTDNKVNLFDYAVWAQGFLDENPQ